MITKYRVTNRTTNLDIFKAGVTRGSKKKRKSMCKPQSFAKGDCDMFLLDLSLDLSFLDSFN
jgi:hypothetical protein